MAQRPYTFPDESDRITALSFLKLVQAQLASSPAVYKEFLSLLLGFGAGTGPGPNAVKDRAYALLRGHPDLVRGLAVFLPGEDAPPGPAREDPAPARPRRDRCPTPAAVDDVRRFLRQVKSRKPEAYDSLLDLIFDAGHAKDLNQIYRRALEIFGHARSYFLSEFVKYLPVPTELERASLPRRRATREPRPEEHRAHAPKRKEPWPEEHRVQPPKRKEPWPEEHRAQAPKRKEPWPEEHRAQAPKRKNAATVVAADYPSSAPKRSRSEDRRTTTTSRRANSPAVADAASKTPFRESWEFETTYTKLVATVTRTEELLEQYEKPETAPPPRGRREFEELFPDPECLEVLREMYQDMFDRIRAALEDGARTELALKTVRRRLEMLEQLAVRRAMECRDPARVEGRMHKLAGDRVKVLLKRRAKKAARIRELAS